MSYKKVACVVSVTVMVVGCGGGGSKGAVKKPVAYDYTVGSTVSSYENGLNNLINVYADLPFVEPDGTTWNRLGDAQVAMNPDSDVPIATMDLNADYIWTDGWTGKGVKVGISDAFNSNGIIDAHGDYVSFIVSSVAPEAQLGFYDTLVGGDVPLSLLELFTNAGEATEWFHDNGYNIVNNSWGIGRAIRDADGNYTGSLIDASTWNYFIDAIGDEVIATPASAEDYTQMLTIFAAGNGGQFCGGGTDDCNLVAAIVKDVRDKGYAIGDRTIWVGALSDDGASLAEYSYAAGAMKYDYLVSYDDVLYYGDAAGTSFSAPRVTGVAALLRQKFPNLDAAALKQVLLQTATDIGAPGVDAVFGYGLIDAENAMSPQGKVVPK